MAPLRALARRLVRCLADPVRHPGAFFAGRRLVGLDGFRLDLADTPALARHFGRPRNGHAAGAFPQLRVVALCELGTHVLWRWRVGPLSCGEMTLARDLLPELHADMLVLGDRAFGNFPVVKAVRGRRAHALLRLKGNSVFAVRERLADGSYLARIYPTWADRQHDRKGIDVRIIRYRLGNGATQRLLTTLLDPVAAPATSLVALYHSRWEEEVAIGELKTHLLDGSGLRSRTVAGVEQEVEGVLLSHYVIRVLMTEAATAAGVEPTRVSFVGALKVLRCRLAECPAGPGGARRWCAAVVQEVATEEGLPERRDRRNPRVIRQKISKWPKKRPKHRRKPRKRPPFHQRIKVLR